LSKLKTTFVLEVHETDLLIAFVMVLPAGDTEVSYLCEFYMRVAHKMTAYYRRSCLFYSILYKEPTRCNFGIIVN